MNSFNNIFSLSKLRRSVVLNFVLFVAVQILQNDINMRFYTHKKDQKYECAIFNVIGMGELSILIRLVTKGR